jgi:carbamoyl-phosphate synthase large subunit
VQCRKTERGVVAFEINPRLSGTTSIRALVGFNEPEILIRYFLTGEFPQTISYQSGYVLRELREKFVPFGQAKNISKTSFGET